MTYFELLSQVIDCRHYERYYDLDFVDKELADRKTSILNCMNNLRGEGFIEHCSPVCSQINFSKINPLSDGDHERLLNIFLILRKLLKTTEKGHFISFQMRNFYK